jgi:hypothetical protein
MVVSALVRWREVDAAAKSQYHLFEARHDLGERRAITRVRVPAFVDERNVLGINAVGERRPDPGVDGLVVKLDRRHADELVLQAVRYHFPHHNREAMSSTQTTLSIPDAQILSHAYAPTSSCRP